MASSTVNVARYSALFVGVVYGWYHRRTLQAKHDKHKLQHAAHDREVLIAKAKEAWKQKQEAKTGITLVTDPDDPRFDLEKVLAKYSS